MGSPLLADHETIASKNELAQLVARTSINSFFPWKSYSPETEVYTLRAGGGEAAKRQPDCYGLLWECTPLTFTDDKAVESITALYKLNREFPERTVVQFMLFSDDDIGGLLRAYQGLKTRPDELAQEAARRYAAYLLEGTKGLKRMSGIPVRRFRLFVALKSPHPSVLEPAVKANVAECLSQAGLSPRHLPAHELVAWLRRILNDRTSPEPWSYDPELPLYKQIVQANTKIRVVPGHTDTVQIGSQWVTCVTPQNTPTDEQISSLSVNQLIGRYLGPMDDTTQLCARFLWTTTVFFATSSESIKQKLDFMGSQSASGGIAKTLKRRNDEGNWIAAELEKEPYVNVMTSVLLFAESQSAIDDAAARTQQLWEARKIRTQRDNEVKWPMLLSAFPFGYYELPKVKEVLRREFEMSSTAAAILSPIQADYGGYMNPVLLGIGRKGQLVSLDVFQEGANNHNFYVAAGTGSGKSFFLNNLVNNYWSCGSKIRITDIGYSFKKQCQAVKGRYLDLGEERKNLCLNPFDTHGGIANAAEDDELIANILLSMVYSATGVANIPEHEATLARAAVAFAKGRDPLNGIDHCHEFLATFPRYSSAGSAKSLDKIIEAAHSMAFNLDAFTSKSSTGYGRLFNGRSTLDMSSDDFVVLEMENIQNDKRLFNIIAGQVINAISQDLYLSDRLSKRFILFDEAWKYFNMSPLLAAIIAEAYRRARKYGGATGIVTQSPLDLLGFGPAGQVIKSNSAFRFLLESNDYKEAVAKGVLDYTGLEFELLNSVKTRKPNYSEIFVDSPFNKGVYRLSTDRWTYFLYSSAAQDYARFEQLKAQGHSAAECVNIMATEAA